MTYLELLERADHLLEKGEITIGEWEDMIAPLRKEIESVSSWSGWVPCSERLPEEEGSYLVTDDAGGMKTVQDDEFLHYEDGTPLWLYSQNVTAWMPLSDPYGGEQNDTD